MPHLTELPCELHFMVATHLDPEDLFCLLLTNRLLHFRFLQSLHKLAAKDKGGLPALHWAVSRGHKPLVTLLLQKEADINSRYPGNGKTLLHLAASRGDTAMVKLLLERGADVNLQDSTGASALYLALGIETDTFKTPYFAFHPVGRSKSQTKGLEETIELLIHNGADPNHYANQEISSLHIAVITQSMRIIRLLLDNGAMVNLPESTGCTPLHTLVSSRKGRVDKIVRLLLEYKADINNLTFHADTALHWAAMTRNKWAVKALLEGGADREARNRDGETALDCALADRAYADGFGDIVWLLEGSDRYKRVIRRRRAMVNLLLE